MANTFGDLSAVREYTPPVRTQTPLQTGPYTGTVTLAQREVLKNELGRAIALMDKWNPF